MNKKLTLYSLALIGLVFSYSSFIFAAEKEANDKEAYLLDPAIHGKLLESHTKIDEGKNGVALKILKKLISSSNLKAYDSAVIYQTMGYAENNMGNFEIALKNFTKRNHSMHYLKKLHIN